MKEVKHVTYTLTKSNYIAKGDEISEYGQQIVCCPGTDELIAQEKDDFEVTKLFRTPEEEYYLQATGKYKISPHESCYIVDDMIIQLAPAPIVEIFLSKLKENNMELVA